MYLELINAIAVYLVAFNVLGSIDFVLGSVDMVIERYY